MISSLLNKIIVVVMDLCTWAAHGLEIMHVPAIDNVEYPWVVRKDKVDNNTDKKEEDSKIPKVKQSKPDIEVQLGSELFDENTKKVQVTVSKVNEEGFDGTWDLNKWNGKGDMPDFREWHFTDDEQLKENKWNTTTTIENYKFVRERIIEDDKVTNYRISTMAGKSKKWAEPYAAAVRKAFKKRLVCCE